MTDEPGWRLEWGPPSAAFWYGVIELQIERLEEVQRSVLAGIDAGTEPGDPYDARARRLAGTRGQLHADAHFLLVAIGNVLRLVDRYVALTGDSDVRDAKTTFARAFPDAKDLRDIVEHLEDYATGKGNLQTAGRAPLDYGFAHVEFDGPGRLEDDLAIHFGELSVRLKSAAQAALRLAGVLGDALRRGRPDEG